MGGRTFQDWLEVSGNKRRMRHCGRGRKGTWEPGSVIEVRGWNITALNITLD